MGEGIHLLGFLGLAELDWLTGAILYGVHSLGMHSVGRIWRLGGGIGRILAWTVETGRFLLVCDMSHLGRSGISELHLLPETIRL